MIISNNGEELKGISLSLYNKGDHGQMTRASYKNFTTTVKNEISEKLADSQDLKRKLAQWISSVSSGKRKELRIS